jgi:glycyl-tRNA synthetase
MEIEFFCHPTEVATRLGVTSDDEWHEYWIAQRREWYLRYGMKMANLVVRPHDGGELAHYAKGCVDLEYNFPSLGFQELEGIANRTNYDLNAHSAASGKKLDYFDPELNERYVPYVIEPSAGVDRTALAFLCDAYDEEEVRGDKRVVLRFHPKMAPIKAAVLPLAKNQDAIVTMARKLKAELAGAYMVRYDDTAGIGKLYRRQDEIGTPVCFTVDHESLEDGQVTARDRDTMEQVRIPAANALAFLREKMEA